MSTWRSRLHPGRGRDLAAVLRRPHQSCTPSAAPSSTTSAPRSPSCYSHGWSRSGWPWLRIASAGIVFALWRRPWRALRRSGRTAWPLVRSLGAVLAVMNGCFYVAIDRLSLGTVAAIEFVPVIALAALGARSLRNAAALALAVAGVYLLVDVRIGGAPLVIAFAFANAVLFAGYIVLAHRVARSRELAPIDGLAAAMLVATAVVTPIGGSTAAPALLDPVALAAGIGVGVASSVIPYVFDQLAMARLSRATYSLMVSLLPATATVTGIVVLAQIPHRVEVVGVALVVCGVALHREETDARAAGGARSATTELGTVSSRRPSGR
jgi:inner membrane transporter RhtA